MLARIFTRFRPEWFQYLIAGSKDGSHLCSHKMAAGKKRRMEFCTDKIEMSLSDLEDGDKEETSFRTDHAAANGRRVIALHGSFRHRPTVDSNDVLPYPPPPLSAPSYSEDIDYAYVDTDTFTQIQPETGTRKSYLRSVTASV